MVRCPEDEKMITSIDFSMQAISLKREKPIDKVNVKIFDARGYYAAWGNKLAGKGFEEPTNYNC